MNKQEAITIVETLPRPASGSGSHVFERFRLFGCATNCDLVLPETIQQIRHCGPGALEWLRAELLLKIGMKTNQHGGYDLVFNKSTVYRSLAWVPAFKATEMLWPPP